MDIVRILLRHNAPIIPDKNGFLPFHWAMLLGHSGVVGLFHVHERASIDHVCNLVYTFSFTHNKSVQLVVENLFGGTTTEYNSIAKRAIIYAVEDIIIIICFVICLLGWN